MYVRPATAKVVVAADADRRLAEYEIPSRQTFVVTISADRRRRKPGRLTRKTKRERSLAPALHDQFSCDYCTVTLMIIPIARCGVQFNSYVPGLMPANETVYASLAFMRSGPLSGAI